jgi:hypothetical protein
MTMAKQAPQRGQIDSGFQPVGGEGVPQAVDAAFTGNAGGVTIGVQSV